MDLTRYIKLNQDKRGLTSIPKISSPLEQSVLEKLDGIELSALIDQSADPMYVHRICRYFVKAFDFVPFFANARGAIGRSEDYKEFRYKKTNVAAIICLLNSSLFYWFWRSYGDGFHCGYGDVYKIRVTDSIAGGKDPNFEQQSRLLMESFQKNSRIKQISTKHDVLKIQAILPRKSKWLVDLLDKSIAEFYGFTDEELDFIINYDIKYRLGGSEAAEE